MGPLTRWPVRHEITEGGTAISRLGNRLTSPAISVFDLAGTQQGHLYTQGQYCARGYLNPGWQG